MNLSNKSIIFIDIFSEIITDIKDKEVLIMIMRALCSKLKTVDLLNELPPLVHQMLKLGSEHNSILLFSSLSMYFAHSYASLTDDNSSQETCESISKLSFVIY